jgi:hypothetical protein
MVIKGALGSLLVLAAASGCIPSSVIGPLQHEREEREKLLSRARKDGVSQQILDAVVPPLTSEELLAIKGQDDSCRASYLWKNGLTWTGSFMVAGAAGVTIGSAYVPDTSKVLFGASAGSLAALGSALVAVGGIIQSGFTDRGCWVR